MKKQFLAVSALALAVMSGSALAAPQDVQFVGTVTNVTCDIKPEVNGTTGNYVQLGSVAVDTSNGVTPPANTGVEFVLKSATGTGCSMTNLNTATVTWIGGFDNQGLTAQSGTATGAKALLTALNSKTQNTAINSGSTSVDFDASKLSATGDGLQFRARLQGGTTAGDYISSAAFLMQYN